MPDQEKDETPPRGVRKIDMRVLERGVRKALAIEPENQKEKGQAKKEHPARKESNLHPPCRK